MGTRLLTAMVGVAAMLAFVPTGTALEAPVVLRYIEVEEGFQPLDEFPTDAPPAAGARFIARDGLYEWDGRERGQRVGHVEAVCTITKATQRSATSHCIGETSLPGGTITVIGYVRFPGRSVLAVVGGTGRYDNARGSATLRELPSGNLALVFRLTP